MFNVWLNVIKIIISILFQLLNTLRAYFIKQLVRIIQLKVIDKYTYQSQNTASNNHQIRNRQNSGEESMITVSSTQSRCL